MPSIDELPADQASALRLLASGMTPDRVAEALSRTEEEVLESAAAAADFVAGPTSDALAASERRRIFEVVVGRRESDPLLEGSPAAQAYRDAIALSLGLGETAIAGKSAQVIEPEPPRPGSPPERSNEPQAGPAPAPPKQAPDQAPKPAQPQLAASPAAAGGGESAPMSATETADPAAAAARRRGAILLGCLAVVVVAVILAATGVFGGSSSDPASTSSVRAVSSATGNGSATSAAGGWTLKNRLRLTSPSGGAAAALAGVETKGSQSALAITGLGLPAKTVIGIWLTGGGKSGLVGFQQVNSKGRFSAIGPLPSNASSADLIVVSRENYSQGSKVPTTPGETLLSGRFSLR